MTGSLTSGSSWKSVCLTALGLKRGLSLWHRAQESRKRRARSSKNKKSMASATSLSMCWISPFKSSFCGIMLTSSSRWEASCSLTCRQKAWSQSMKQRVSRSLLRQNNRIIYTVRLLSSFSPKTQVWLRLFLPRMIWLHKYPLKRTRLLRYSTFLILVARLRQNFCKINLWWVNPIEIPSTRLFTRRPICSTICYWTTLQSHLLKYWPTNFNRAKLTRQA